MRKSRLIKIAALLVLLALPAFAAGTVDVIQNGRAFSVATIEIARGTVIHFLNQDEFIHHIYVDDPRFKFSSDEQPPGTEVDLAFTQAGTFSVRCAIHPKMHLVVTVR